MDAHVKIDAGELREEPSGVFPTKYKPKQKLSNATTSVDTQTLQHLVMQHDSLSTFVKTQFEWQKQVNAYLNKGKMTFLEPVLPSWMREEEDEDDVPLAAVHLKAVKKEKAKRMRVKHVMTHNPFEKKKKGEVDAVLEKEPEKVEKESELQQPVEEDPKRARLEVRNKLGAKRGDLLLQQVEPL